MSETKVFVEDNGLGGPACFLGLEVQPDRMDQRPPGVHAEPIGGERPGTLRLAELAVFRFERHGSQQSLPCGGDVATEKQRRTGRHVDQSGRVALDVEEAVELVRLEVIITRIVERVDRTPALKRAEGGDHGKALGGMRQRLGMIVLADGVRLARDPGRCQPSRAFPRPG